MILGKSVVEWNVCFACVSLLIFIYTDSSRMTTKLNESINQFNNKMYWTDEYYK